MHGKSGAQRATAVMGAVAAKYRNQKGIGRTLADRVKDGSRRLGDHPHDPNVVTDDDLQAMLQWILVLK